MPLTRQLREQKWILDRIISIQGVESVINWIRRLPFAAGMELYVDYNDFKAKIKRYDDISRELIKIGEKREAMAHSAAAAGHLVTARDNFFSAAVCYNVAHMTTSEEDLQGMIACNTKKNQCYDAFIKFAPYPAERIEIPFGDKSLPGYLHLPAKGQQNWPCVIDIGGLEVLKEILNPVYNNKFIERGIAILSFDGPGQGEARLRNIFFETNDWIRAGQAAMDFAVKRSPVMDSQRIGIRGFSLGIRTASQIAANDPRYAAIATHGSGLGGGGGGGRAGGGGSPRRGGPTGPDPTLKEKVMFMHGFQNEEEFDREFHQRDTFEGVPQKIQCPFLIVTGQSGGMGPVSGTVQFYNDLKGPKKLMMYQGEGHEIRQTCDVDAMIADWFRDRFDGKPMVNEIVSVDSSGIETRR